MGIAFKFLAALSLVLLVAGCASAPPASDKQARAEYEQQNDPAEPTNRAIFTANKAVDDYAIKPVAKGYRYIPGPVRKSLRSFFTNMHEPWTFLNELMQGEFKRSGQTLGRFSVNTTAGIFGFFDLMDEKLGPAHDEDFGQTLAVWGVGEGPYMVLPILGPSNPRDAVGTAVGYIVDPAGLALDIVLPAYAMTSLTVVGGVDKREKYLDQLDEVERSSLDYYASLRSLYRQKRQADVLNGKKPKNMPVIDYSLYSDPAASSPQQATSAKTPVTQAAPSFFAPQPASGFTPQAAAPRPNYGVGVSEEQQRMEDLVKAMRARMSEQKS